MEDPVKELCDLLREAGARVTLDPKRSIRGPCFLCSDKPSGARSHGLYFVASLIVDAAGNFRRLDPVERPVCDHCVVDWKRTTGEWLDGR